MHCYKKNVCMTQFYSIKVGEMCRSVHLPAEGTISAAEEIVSQEQGGKRNRVISHDYLWIRHMSPTPPPHTPTLDVSRLLQTIMSSPLLLLAKGKETQPSDFRLSWDTVQLTYDVTHLCVEGGSRPQRAAQPLGARICVRSIIIIS
jgi:hypothetical protein